MIQSGFFNSVNGDRKYNAEFFAKFFGTLIGNGVFPNPSTGLQVYESSNMTVTVKPGKGWINGYFIINDNDFNLTLANADGVLNRIDRIVMRYENANRQINILVKQGDFASTPVAPTLQRDADYYELALADVYVGKGVTAITQANINDQRLNTSVCGIVKGLIDQVDTTTIFNQYQAWYQQVTGSTQAEIDAWQEQQEQEFNDWFATVQNTLSGDVAGNLASQITTLQQDFAAHKTEYATFKEATEADSITFKNHITDYVKHPGIATTTNNGNDYAVTLNPAPTSYANAMGLVITVNADSTGPATINVNGLGTIPIKKADGSPMKSLKKDGVYTLRYSNLAFILQGEGGDYSDSLVDNVQNAYKSSGIADVALTVNDRIQSKYFGFPNDYTFDVPLRSVYFNSISRDGSRLMLGTTSTLYFYKKNPGTKQFIKQVLTIAENNITKVEFAGDYVIVARTTAPYLKVYKIDANFTTATPVTVDIQPSVVPGYLSVSSDGKKVLVSPNSDGGTPANMFQLYILQLDGSFAKMGLPDVYPLGSYTYQAAMSRDGTTIALSMASYPYNYVYKIDNDGTQTKQIINNPSSSRPNTIPTGTLCSDNGELFFATWYYSSNNVPGLIIYKKQPDGSYSLMFDVGLSGSTGYLDRSITRMDYYKDVLAIATATSSRHYFKVKQSDGVILLMTTMSGSTNATALQLFDDVTTPYPVCIWSFNLTSSSVGTDTMGRRLYKFTDATLSKLASALDANLIKSIEHIGFSLGTVNAGELVDYVGVWGVY